MPEINGPVMFPVGFIGFIGKSFVEIVEVKLRWGSLKKAVPAEQII